MPTHSALSPAVRPNLKLRPRDVNDAAASRETPNEARFEIQGAHRDGSRHVDAVWNVGWDPDGALGGDDPDALRGTNGHDSAGRVNELIVVMEVLGYGVARGKVIDQSGDLSGRMTTRVEE